MFLLADGWVGQRVASSTQGNMHPNDITELSLATTLKLILLETNTNFIVGTWQGLLGRTHILPLQSCHVSCLFACLTCCPAVNHLAMG